jgi:transcription initiation factor TFIIA large subunit
VIDEVIHSIRSDFTNQGVDEQVLTDLQAAWEKKLIEANVFPPAHTHTPTMFINTPIPLLGNLNSGNMESRVNVMQIPYINRGSARMTQYTKTVPTATLPMIQGQASTSTPHIQPGIAYFQNEQADVQSNISSQHHAPVNASSMTLPKDATEPVKESPMKSNENEDELNSDLDSSLTSSSTDEEAPGDLNENIILCLYEKVNRTRNRWRASFKAGSLHLNGVDYAFNRQNAEFEF